MVPFSFATAGTISFGPGVSEQAGVIASRWGKRVLVVRGGNESRIQSVLSSLESENCSFDQVAIRKEPDINLLRQLCTTYRDHSFDVVVAVGGGSVLDAGKALAALAANPGDPLEYLEVVGAGKPLKHPPWPLVAIPTTAGTGSEVTRNAVLALPSHKVKVSLRSPLMYPRVALIDPVLTYTLPARVTAMTGLDALTQVIEPYLSGKANPLIDALCASAIPKCARALPLVCEQGSHFQARYDMALTSLIGGLALANAGLGVVHGFAGPLGGMFSAPHGSICAAILPHAFACNMQACSDRQPDSPFLQRGTQVAAWLTGSSNATVKDGVNWLKELNRELKVPSLATFGISEKYTTEIVEKVRNSSSMKGNPIKLKDDELADILKNALS